jgi:hypothetical protein
MLQNIVQERAKLYNKLYIQEYIVYRIQYSLY